MRRGGIAHRVRDRIECMRVRPLLQPFLDGELTAPQRERFETHLAACERCGLAVDTYRGLLDHLNGLAAPPDRDAVARLEAFVEELDDPPSSDPSAGDR